MWGFEPVGGTTVTLPVTAVGRARVRDHMTDHVVPAGERGGNRHAGSVSTSNWSSPPVSVLEHPRVGAVGAARAQALRGNGRGGRGDRVIEQLRARQHAGLCRFELSAEVLRFVPALAVSDPLSTITSARPIHRPR